MTLYKDILLVLSIACCVPSSFLCSMQPSVSNSYTPIYLSPQYPLVSNTVMAVSVAYVISVFRSPMTCKKLGKNIAIAGACGVLYGYMYLAFQSDMSDEMRICMHNMAHAVSMLSGAVVGALL